MILFRLIFESFRFSWNALVVNPLRTILSLLGVTVGIFAIIAVFTLVDSLEKSVKNSFSFLGENTIYIEKWPYGFDNDYPWWKYFKRPQPVYDEYRFIAANSRYQQASCIQAEYANVALKQGNNAVYQNELQGVGPDYEQVFEFDIAQGRYFTMQEIESGADVCVLGHDIAQKLFPSGNAVNGVIKVKGRKFRVAGLMEQEGDNLLGTTSKDEVVLIPFLSFNKMYTVGGPWGASTSIAVKGREDDPGLLMLEGELQGLMRKVRGLRPRQDDNFALNRPEAIAGAIEATFAVLTIAGWVIGSFSILVGGFGIANIMFVSVKERTNIIGIQKSLGAKNSFILLQFLFEAIFLSLIGGLFGLFIVYLLTFIPLGSLELALSFKNVILGLGVASFVGILSGILPAYNAARLDPVVALRSA